MLNDLTIALQAIHGDPFTPKTSCCALLSSDRGSRFLSQLFFLLEISKNITKVFMEVVVPHLYSFHLFHLTISLDKFWLTCVQDEILNTRESKVIQAAGQVKQLKAVQMWYLRLPLKLLWYFFIFLGERTVETKTWSLCLKKEGRSS